MRPDRTRLALFALLYASEGAPIGFIWWALPTLMRAEGLPVERITAVTAVLVLPWTLKFIWAPLVDALGSPRWGLRAWIAAAQSVMGLALVPLVWLDPREHFETWVVLLLVHAFAAATQDVAIDALAIRLTPPGQRGLLNGCMQAGMLLGRSVFGGGALLIVETFGRGGLLAGLILCIWASLPILPFVDEPARVASVRRRMAEFLGHLRSAAARRRTWLGLGFALLSASAFEATGALAGPYLIDLGLSRAGVGRFFLLVVVAAMLGGGLVGGRIADRLGPSRAVFWALLGFVAMVVGLATVELTHGPSATWGLILLTGMYLCVGLFTAASYALYMDLTDPRLGGTQFSAFMAATNGCESWSVWIGGQAVARSGYAGAFLVTSLASLLSLSLLAALGRRYRGSGPVPAEGSAVPPDRA